jgi:SNF2 family DNA or RNA helicase
VAAPSFQLVFSLYSHPLFGILVEPYLVQKLANGSLSLSFQRVAIANLQSFLPDASEHEMSLVKLLQSYSNIHIAKELKVKVGQLDAALLKTSLAKDLKTKALFEHFKQNMTQTKSRFFQALDGSEALFETGSDGYPAARSIEIRKDVSVVFNYNFGPEKLQVKPVFSDKQLDNKAIQVLDAESDLILAGNWLLRLPKELKSARFKPFLDKSEMEIDNRFVKEFCQKFVVNDIRNGLARLEGDVQLEEICEPTSVLNFKFNFIGQQIGLFEESDKAKLQLPEFLEIEIQFLYGDQLVSMADPRDICSIKSDSPIHFQHIRRTAKAEKRWIEKISELLEIEFKSGKATISFEYLRDKVLQSLDNLKDEIKLQFSPEFRQLTLKSPKIKVNFNEKIDYFEIEGSIDWDGFSLELNELRKNFQMNNGWIQVGQSFFPIPQNDEQFISQLMNLSDAGKEFVISRKAAKAIQSAGSSAFGGPWNRLLSLLGPPPKFSQEVPGLNPDFSLRDYQMKGLEWMFQLSANQLGGILADDMGLGKTIQTAAFLLTQLGGSEKIKPILIALPSTLLFNWQYELKRFSSRFKLYLHFGPGRSKRLNDVMPWCNVILVSYQTLARDTAFFNNQTFSTLIIDEAHNLKNQGTAIYKAVSQIKAEQVFLLTGTPIQNSPMDLWALSELCNPGLLSAKLKPQSLNKLDSNPKLLEKLRFMQSVLKPLILRRTKQNVLSELPEKTIATVHCSMTDNQEKEYLAVHKEVLVNLAEASFNPGSSRNVQILKGLTMLRMAANHPSLLNEESVGSSGKFDLVIEKLTEVLAEGHKVLLFSAFVRHLHLFKKHLDENSISYSLLTGQTRDREAQVEAFKQDPNRQVFLISLKAGGVGLNLVEASYVFLLDPWWNPAAENQAMDRVYRIGQKNPVTVYKFITSGTVEEKIVQLQERKQVLADQLFGSEEVEDQYLSIDLLQEILTSKSS